MQWKISNCVIRFLNRVLNSSVILSKLCLLYPTGSSGWLIILNLQSSSFLVILFLLFEFLQFYKRIHQIGDISPHGSHILEVPQLFCTFNKQIGRFITFTLPRTPVLVNQMTLSSKKWKKAPTCVIMLKNLSEMALVGSLLILRMLYSSSTNLKRFRILRFFDIESYTRKLISLSSRSLPSDLVIWRAYLRPAWISSMFEWIWQV